MRYTFTHQIQFKSGDETRPYRSTQWWKTEKGAMRAAERHSQSIEKYYAQESIAVHALVIYDDQGRFVTNEAA